MNSVSYVSVCILHEGKGRGGRVREVTVVIFCEDDDEDDREEDHLGGK